MKKTIVIDGCVCEVIPTEKRYNNLVLVKNGNLTGCYSLKNKKLVDGWHGQTNTKYSNIPINGRKPW